jgi:hypothetical protein
MMAAVKASTASPGRRSKASGTSGWGSNAINRRVPHSANTRPAAAPAIDSNKLSLNNWLTIRPRPAPNARRMAISCSRAELRAMIRLATLAHEISKTIATRTISSSRAFSILCPVVARPAAAGAG